MRIASIARPLWLSALGALLKQLVVEERMAWSGSETLHRLHGIAAGS